MRPGVRWVEVSGTTPACVFVAFEAARMTTATSLDVTSGDDAHLPD